MNYDQVIEKLEDTKKELNEWAQVMNEAFQNQNDPNGRDLAQFLDENPSLKERISDTGELLRVATYLTDEWFDSKTKRNHEDHDTTQEEQKKNTKRLKDLNDDLIKIRTDKESLMAKLKQYDSIASSLNSKLEENNISKAVAEKSRTKEQLAQESLVLSLAISKMKTFQNTFEDQSLRKKLEEEIQKFTAEIKSLREIYEQKEKNDVEKSDSIKELDKSQCNLEYLEECCSIDEKHLKCLNETRENILKEWDALDNEKICRKKEIIDLENQLENMHFSINKKKADILLLVICIIGILLGMGVLAVTMPIAAATFNTFQENEKDIIRKQIELKKKRIIALDEKCTQHTEVIWQIYKEKQNMEQTIDNNTANAKNIKLFHYRQEKLKDLRKKLADKESVKIAKTELLRYQNRANFESQIEILDQDYQQKVQEIKMLEEDLQALSLKQTESYNHKLEVRKLSTQEKLIIHNMKELSIQKKYLEEKDSYLGQSIKNQKAREDNLADIKEEYMSCVQKPVQNLNVAIRQKPVQKSVQNLYVADPHR